MNVLITGATGFLGKILTKILISSNEIYTLSRSNSNYNVNLSESNPLFNEIYDVVIHAAGKSHFIPKTEIEVANFRKINVIGTLNLLHGLYKSGIPKKFVFISSVSVYGIIEGMNINETTPLLAKDPYGRSKIKAEEIVISWCKEHNVICTILRLPLVVGVNPPGNLGAMIRGIKKGYYFNIAGGNSRKSMVLATDIAKFILEAAEIGGVYNLTDGFHPSFNELSKFISKKLGKTFVPNLPLFAAIILAKLGDKIGRIFPLNSNKLSKITSSLTFDDLEARIAFGWKPTKVLEGFKLHEHD